MVKTTSGDIYIVETKGNEDLDVEPKRTRHKQWCEDVNAQQKKHTYKELFVSEEDFRKYQVSTFAELSKLLEN